MKIQTNVLLVVLFSLSHTVYANDDILVAVAANMARTIEHIQQKFRQQTGNTIRFSLGSSGSLTHQIENGAPFAVFLAADRSYIDRLTGRGIAKPPAVHYASGRICFYIPNHSPMADIEGLGSLTSRLTFGDFDKLAIANPRHAPYGRAAQTALQRSGIWSLESRKLVIAENIAQAMQFTNAGAVDAGIVAWSHYIGGGFQQRGQCLLIPEHWHDPLAQYMVLLQHDNPVAASFVEFMQSDTIRKLLTDNGYLVP